MMTKEKSMSKFTANIFIRMSWTKEEVIKICNDNLWPSCPRVNDLTDDQCQALVNSFIWNLDGFQPPENPSDDERMTLNDVGTDLVADILNLN